MNEIKFDRKSERLERLWIPFSVAFVVDKIQTEAMLC